MHLQVSQCLSSPSTLEVIDYKGFYDRKKLFWKAPMLCFMCNGPTSAVCVQHVSGRVSGLGVKHLEQLMFLDHPCWRGQPVQTWFALGTVDIYWVLH